MTKVSTREQQKARDVYQENLIGGCAFSFMGLFALQAAFYGALWGLERLTGLSLPSVEHSLSGPLFIFVMLSLMNFVPTRYAAWQVRKSGLSQERESVESLESVGQHAALVLRDEASYEPVLLPSKTKQWFALSSLLFLWVVLTAGAVFLWHDPQGGFAMRVLAIFASALVLGLILLFALILIRHKSPLCLDSAGLEATPFLKTHRVRWNEVHSLDIVTRFNVVGDRSATYYRFRNAAGETILTLGYPLLTHEQADMATNALRQVGTGQTAPQSQINVSHTLAPSSGGQAVDYPD